jgi:hypothetical protein
VAQGDPKLGLDLEVGGVDAAIADLGRVQQATDRIAERQTRQFQQTTEQIREEIEFRELRAQAASREEREIEQARRRQQAAAEQAAASQRAQSDAMRDSATASIALVTRVQGVASAVTALSAALGDRNATTGLVANVAGTTAQFAAMGAALGPQGAVVGAIVGALIPAVTALSEEFGRAEREERAFIDQLRSSIGTIEDYTRAIREAQAARARASRMSLGVAGADEYEASAQRGEDQVRLAEAQQAQLRRQLEEARASHSFFNDTTGEVAELTDRIRELQVQIESGRDFVRQDRERAAAAAAEEAEILMEDLTAAAQAGDTGGGGGGGRGRGRARSGPDLDALMGRAAGSGDPIAAIVGRADADRQRAEEAELEAKNAAEVARREQMQAALEETKALQEAQRDLELTSQDAQRSFSEGWTASIDDVVDSFRDANSALKAAGQQSISIGRLMERSLIASGNAISETIGGTMKSAFEDALGAWLDGSVDFVKAAEEMAKGVIKALVIESIVQAVTETARAIADLASYRYDSAAAHFAAAAAWAAVGVVAGGVGAGIGAFGGGGDKGSEEGKASGGRDLASRSTAEDRGPQTTIINVYPGMVLSTQRDLQAAVYDVINGGARDGMRIDSRATRGA